MRVIHLMLIAVLAFAAGVNANEAPETLSEAMHNFGRGFLRADFLVQKADNDPESISEKEVQEAVDGIDRVLLNVETIIQGTGAAALIPSKAQDMKEPDRTAYLNHFYELMGQFRDVVREYRALFVAHDFQHLSPKRSEVLALAKAAHDSL